MNVQKIHINKFPVVLISDSHTNLSNIRKLKELYPDNKIFSLGDICFLFSKPGERFNEYSIQYFIDNKIPTLASNHDVFVGWEDPDNTRYELPPHQIDYLRNLPYGFKIVLPYGKYYLLYHHAPKDLWGRNEKGSLTGDKLKEIYKFDDNCLGIIHGHLHQNFIEEFPNFKTKRISLGQLCGSNHHTGENNGNNYLLLTEKGLEYKKI